MGQPQSLKSGGKGIWLLGHVHPNWGIPPTILMFSTKGGLQTHSFESLQTSFSPQSSVFAHTAPEIEIVESGVS